MKVFGSPIYLYTNNTNTHTHYCHFELLKSVSLRFPFVLTHREGRILQLSFSMSTPFSKHPQVTSSKSHPFAPVRHRVLRSGAHSIDLQFCVNKRLIGFSNSAETYTKSLKNKHLSKSATTRRGRKNTRSTTQTSQQVMENFAPQIF